MARIAIIPARGGSKRIPRKNIRNFLGKPILSYSIQAALTSDLFDEVMVSTDDKETAEIAKKYGAKVPFLRSSKNSDDYASTVDVLTEVLQEYKSIGKKFDEACCIYSTAPFVTRSLLFEAYKVYNDNKFDVVFPSVEFGFPIQRAIKINKQNKMSMYQVQYQFSRSQDLEPAYHDTGQFYWFRPDVLTKEKRLWTDNTGVIVISNMQAQDIDTLEDWTLAEIKYTFLKKKQHDQV